MRTVIINDIHIGPNRVGGTTPESAKALNAYVHEQYANLLKRYEGPACRIIVNGDLTDSYQVPLADALKLLDTTASWLNDNPESEMVWSLGNHSLSKDSAKMGTEQFLGAILKEQFPGRFILVDKPTHLGQRMHCIPHLVNADDFDAALEAVPEGTKYLLLHCNYNNEFAAQTLHSLNLSEVQAKRMATRGITMILGHEHQNRSECGGKVLVVGNQFPTSIADCLGNDCKYLLEIEDDGSTKWVETWNRNGNYVEVDWQRLDRLPIDTRFVRVVGTAQAEEAPQMAQAIASYRKASTAFVVSNSVSVVSGDGEDAGFEKSLEAVKGFDVMSALRDFLTPEEFKVLEKL